MFLQTHPCPLSCPGLGCLESGLSAPAWILGSMLCLQKPTNHPDLWGTCLGGTRRPGLVPRGGFKPFLLFDTFWFREICVCLLPQPCSALQSLLEQIAGGWGGCQLLEGPSMTHKFGESGLPPAALRCNICAVTTPLSLFSAQKLVCSLQGLAQRSKSGCSAASWG